MIIDKHLVDSIVLALKGIEEALNKLSAPKKESAPLWTDEERMEILRKEYEEKVGERNRRIKEEMMREYSRQKKMEKDNS